ncbi:hypothetical protein K7640_21135 [Micromonospora sp. PLK6-60]|uniref:DUF4190 domain-containing protein n=1 Tax=Micromonospora sp. PLK6-60 TaxID=2873383 RepID=UPI001CA61307|nr:DUF4190 domain-containing protein [Micromonospora sp. PLK6-60]MBY8874340.1 hypothetical protein [Micromonospora sp. PLK6-60]
MQPGQPGQDPYGQQPNQDPTAPHFPADPYGQSPQAPQPPYGQQPTSGQPYGQPDPYAAPPQAPYGQQPTSGQPYGQQPTSGQPYGQQQPYQDPYGAQQPYGAQGYPNAGYPQPQGQNNTLGLVSMILGIAAIPMVCCLYLGIPLGIAAVITGYLGRQKAAQGLASNGGQAKAGLICGAVAVGLGILLIILSIVGQGLDLPTSP